MEKNSDISDFNMHMSQYSARLFMVSGRFFDLAPTEWEKLACSWYGKHGWRELKDDRYIGKLPNGQDVIRYHSVDAIVLENPELDPTAQMIYDRWVARRAQLAAQRNSPDVVILPPPPEPPKAKPVELPPPEPKPEPKKARPEWIVKASVWLTVFTPVSLVILYFVPPPWNMVAKAVFEAIKLLIGG